MNPSLFLELILRYLPSLDKIIEKVNGKRNNKLTYLHETMLRKEYSPDQKWESASVNTTYVAADIVDMDSPLPVKKRDSLAHANGDLPTIGMKLWLGNKQINAVNIMIARKVVTTQIIAKLLNDSARCVTGMKERLEMCFLQGLSEGVTAVEDAENVGTGVRLKFGYLPQNCFGATIKWGEQGFTPISDFARILAKDSGISFIMLAKETYNLMRQSDEARELAANYAGSLIMDGVKLPVPNPTKFNEAFKDEYKCDFLIVDRDVVIEKDGRRSTIRPWNCNKVIFLTSTEVGALVYGTLPEETHKVEGVEYAKPLEYALLSKYSKNDPLREYTAIQGIVAPIIENVDQIYSLDISEAQTVDTVNETKDAGDVKITIWGATYNKAEFIAALKNISDDRIASNIGDSKLIEKVNALSDENEAKLKAAVESHKVTA